MKYYFVILEKIKINKGDVDLRIELSGILSKTNMKRQAISKTSNSVRAILGPIWSEYEGHSIFMIFRLHHGAECKQNRSGKQALCFAQFL